jgi:hypothetical protein
VQVRISTDTRRGGHCAGVPAVRERGASDLRLLMVALWKKRLCLTCLVARTGVAPLRVEEMLTLLGRVLVVRWSTSSCEGCSAPKAMVTLV